MFFLDFSFITTTLICCVFSLIIFYWYKNYYNHFWKGKGIPYETPKSIAHVLYGLYKAKSKPLGLVEFERDLYKKHGRVFGSYELTKAVIYVAEPELLKSILVKDFSNFDHRREVATSINVEFFNDFLSVVNGEKWKRLRSIVSPTFTSGKLKGMMPYIGECADLLSQNLSKAAGDSGEPVDCRKLAGNFVMDAIATVAFGTKLDSHNDPNNVFVENARKAFTFELNWKMILFFISPKLYMKYAFGVGPFKFFAELTQNIMDRRKKNNEVHNDFLQMMMEHLEGSPDALEGEKKANHKVMSMTELISQCLLFFVGGFDTTSATIALTLHHLAFNRKAQDRVIEEVDAFWKDKVDADATAASGTRYLEACVSETLRLYPIATRLERVSSEDYELGDTGITIPKGMLVGVPIFCMHRDEEFFPEADKFIPDRFLPENSERIIPFSYLPFGNGPRNCIAMRFVLLEIKTCLLHLFKDLSFAPGPETKDPPVFSQTAGLLKPKDVMLRVTKRNKN